MAFSRRCTITPNTGQVTGTITDWPVLVSVTHNDLRAVGNGGYAQNSNGYDIRPYADADLTVALDFELVAYNASTGLLKMWVNVPSVAVGTPYYLGIGDASLNTDGSSTATWPTAYKNVIHGGDGSTPSAADSSQSNLDGTLQNTPGATTGKINGAITFNGTDEYITLPNIGVSGGSARTISFWMYATAESGGAGNYAFAAGTTSNLSGFAVRVKLATSAPPYVQTINNDVSMDGAGALSLSTWYHIMFVYDGGAFGTSGFNPVNFAFYINGTASAGPYVGGGTMQNNTLTTADSNWGWATYVGAGPAGYYQGYLEEMRIMSGAATAAQAELDYKSQNNPAAFAAYAFDAAPGGGPGALQPLIFCN